MVKLGVNIDHIATLRNARGDFFPSLVYAAGVVEQAGGDFITTHLREDRRHIKDDDIYLLKNNITTSLNMEMACNDDVLDKALSIKPYKVTLVPEKREEKTTEGGIDITNGFSKVSQFVKTLKNAGILVSLFIEPDIKLIDNIVNLDVDDVEIHTGKYSLSTGKLQQAELNIIKTFADKVSRCGVKICAGHGLTYQNVAEISSIPQITELNIGYSIITRAIFVGLGVAVSEMKKIIVDSRICTIEK